MSIYSVGLKHQGSGITIPGVIGEAVPRGAAVYMSSVDGRWYLADADVLAELPVVGITKEASAVVGRVIPLIVIGTIGRSDWTWTRGDPIYVSGVPGGLTQIAPINAQSVAVALTSTLIYVNPGAGVVAGATYTKMLHIGVGTFKIPAAGDPAVVIQDNTVMLSFNQNDTEDAYLSWEIPTDYAGGDLSFYLHWTNDGGVDDNGKNIRFQLNYQSMTNGLVVSGSHANSPKTINDTYTSAAGWIMHTTDAETIAAADFAGRHMIEFRLTAIVAAVTQLTGEPHLLSIMIGYTAYADPT